MKHFLLYLMTLSLMGCASITGDSGQLIKIEAITQEGQTVTGASCKLTNDFGATSGKSGESIQVHRSSKDLDINCSTPGKADASARATSRANAGMAGNIIFGGAIGAVIDHNKGTAYTYPTWMRLVFGQTRYYDRREEKEGTALMGRATGTPDSINTGVAGSSASTTAQLVGSSDSPQPGWLASGFARIDDVDAIPYLTNRGRDAYREWLLKPTPRAFAMASNGHFGRAWTFSLSKDHPEWPADPNHRALYVCEVNAKMPCKLYAINGAVVWPKDTSPAASPLPVAAPLAATGALSTQK